MVYFNYFSLGCFVYST